MKFLQIVLCSLLILPLFAEREMSLGDYSREARRTIEGKLRKTLDETGANGEVAGTVTYASDEQFFIQVEDDGLKILVDDACGDKPPAVGDVTAVTGRPTLEGGRVVLLAQGWRKVGTDELPRPVGADSDSLVYAGEGKSVNWRRVEVEGRAIGVTQNGFAINVDGLPVNVVLAKLPDFLRDCERTHPKVKVVGVAELMLDQSVFFSQNHYVMGVKLNASSADDVVLEPDLIYLTNLRDGRMTIVWTALIALLAAGVLAFAFVVFRQRRRLFRSRTVMAERKRMADDLHDTIEQHLVGAGMFLKLNRLKEADEILVRAKREMRDIVWGLKNADMMRLSPADMIRQLAKEENKKGIYRVDTRLEGLPAHLEAAQMRDLSLIVRESIGTAIKHGGAKKIALAADGNGEHWTLRVANDGKPFDPATAPGPSEGHFGVEGMRQRARRIGATVSFVERSGWMVMEVTK